MNEKFLSGTIKPKNILKEKFTPKLFPFGGGDWGGGLMKFTEFSLLALQIQHNKFGKD